MKKNIDDQIYETRENLRLYLLSEEDRKKELNRFQDAGGKILPEKKKINFFNKKKQVELNEKLKKNKIINDNKKSIKDFFLTGSLIKQVEIPVFSKEKRDKKGLSRFFNNLKIDIFSIKNKTKIKTKFDIFRSILSIFNSSLSDYVNNLFINTIHLDLLVPLRDLGLFSKELMKIDKKDDLYDPELVYLFKMLNALNSIEVNLASTYLDRLEKSTIRPYKYYELAPILKYLYPPLIILNDVYKNKELNNFLNIYSKKFPEKNNIINSLRELINNYFKIYKLMMYPILLKDIGGTFYDHEIETEDYKRKLMDYFNISEKDIVEATFENFKIKYKITQHDLLKDNNKTKTFEEIENQYTKFPPRFTEILDLLQEFFPSRIIEIKNIKKKSNIDSENNVLEFKVDFRELNRFTDIFRYFHCPSDNNFYVLDDRLLHLSKFHPISHLSVFLVMLLDLLSGLTNIKYLEKSKIEYEGEEFSCANYFKNTLEDIAVLFKYTINKLGDIIRDIGLSYRDNHNYLRTSSFESYLDEITIFLKKNFINNIEFSKTITGISIEDIKFAKFDVKKTLFIEPFYESVRKLKFAIDDICYNIDKRNKPVHKYISQKELESPMVLGSVYYKNSAFIPGFASVFIKTEYNGIKLVTNDQRTNYNYLFFTQKFINLIYYIIHDKKSYILNYAHPAILRNQPNRLLRIIDEGTTDLIYDSNSIKISKLINQRINDRQNLILENIKLKEEIEKSNIHATTGVFTKKYFLDNYPKMVNDSRTLNIPLSMIIIDLDDFKKLNDSAGHDFGDFVLECVGKMIKDILRKEDIVSNYKGDIEDKSLIKFASCFGGDEFVLLLTNTDINNAKIVAERILDELNGNIYYLINKEYKRKLEENLKKNEIDNDLFSKLIKIIYKISASLGIAEYDQSYTKDKFFEYADTGVYASKMNGKNSFSIYDKDGYICFSKNNKQWNSVRISFDEVKLWQSKNK